MIYLSNTSWHNNIQEIIPVFATFILSVIIFSSAVLC